MGKENCPVSEDRRSNIDSVVKDIHEDQSGRVRHKCSYCAYEKGLEAGYEKAKKDVVRSLFPNG